MSKKGNKKSKFKREYIPVIFAFLILILLIVALVFVILYDREDLDVNIPDPSNDIEEIEVDTSDSACSSSELATLNNAANNVTVSYEDEKIVVGQGYDIDGDYEGDTAPLVDLYGTVFNVSFANITDDIYLRITNDTNDTELTFTKENMDAGEAVFQTEYGDELTTYTVEVLASNYDCADEVIRKFNLTVPIYNQFSEMEACNTYPNFYYCQEYIDTEPITYSEFLEELRVYRDSATDEDTVENTNVINVDNDDNNDEEEQPSEDEKSPFINFVENNRVTLIVGGCAIVVVGVIAGIVIVKKKRSKRL